jgi:hypothetical protein
MLAVFRATMYARAVSPMVQTMSVTSIGLANWVCHVVGMADTGAVVLRKRLVLGGHPRGSRYCDPVAWVAYPT